MRQAVPKPVKQEETGAGGATGGKSPVQRKKTTQEKDSKGAVNGAAHVKEEQSPLKPKREKQVYDLPGQRRPTPPEVSQQCTRGCCCIRRLEVWRLQDTPAPQYLRALLAMSG